MSIDPFTCDMLSLLEFQPFANIAFIFIYLTEINLAHAKSSVNY